MQARGNAALLASSFIILSSAVAFVGAGEPRNEALELATPEGASEDELVARLDDDLGAGEAGALPVALLEALCEREPERFGATVEEAYRRFGFAFVRGRERPVGITERKVLGARLRNYNCLVCHAGSEDGKLVVGAPARTLDFAGFYASVIQATRRAVASASCRTSGVLELEAAALR